MKVYFPLNLILPAKPYTVASISFAIYQAAIEKTIIIFFARGG